MCTNPTSHWFSFRSGVARSRRRRLMRSALSTGALSLVGFVALGTVAASAAPCPSLGVAAPFAILGATGVTSSGGSSVVGDVGSAISLNEATGVVPGLVNGLLGTVNGLLGGTSVVTDTAAQSAEGAAASAYQSAAADVPTHTFSGGALLDVTLSPGVYAWPRSLSLSGLVTLNALGNRHGDFVFQIPGNLVSSAQSLVSLKGGAQASNVLWQVGGDVTLAPSTSLVGTILADHDITLDRGTSLLGRAQSLTGLVNIDASTVTLPRVLSGVTASVRAVTSRASTVVPSSGASTAPSDASTTCTCAVTSLAPNVLPLIPLSAIAMPDLAVPSSHVGAVTGEVPGLLGVIPLGSAAIPVGALPTSVSGVGVPSATAPSTSTPSVSLPSLVSPVASPSVPSVSGLAPNLSLPSLVSPVASPSVPSVSGPAPNLSLPELVSPTASPSVPSVSGLTPNLSLPELVSPSVPSTPSASGLAPNLDLPSLAGPSIPSISLPLVSSPLSSTSPGSGSLIHARVEPSSTGSHAKVSTHAKSTTTTTVPSSTSVPVGAPATGEGGPSGTGGDSRMLVALGALVVALGSAALGLRRRHVRG
jgi:Ice-binding-like